MNRNTKSMTMALLLAAGALPVTAHAAVTITTDSGTTGTFSVANADLVNQGQPTFVALTLDSGTALYDSSVAKLNDGSVYGNDPNPGATPNTLTPSEGAVITFTLNTATNIYGYDISQIISLTGSGQGRDVQSYDVEYSVVGSASFQSLVSVVNQGTHDSNPLENRVRLDADGSQSLTMPIAQSVDALRITFHNANGLESMYREFDVFGAASIPEPSAAWLLGLGGLLAWRRWVK